MTLSFNNKNIQTISISGNDFVRFTGGGHPIYIGDGIFNFGGQTIALSESLKEQFHGIKVTWLFGYYATTQRMADKIQLPDGIDATEYSNSLIQSNHAWYTWDLKIPKNIDTTSLRILGTNSDLVGSPVILIDTTISLVEKTLTIKQLNTSHFSNVISVTGY